METVQQVIENGLPLGGIRVYEDIEALSLGRECALAVMTPIEGQPFAWKWTRSDGGMDFFKSTPDAVDFLRREYGNAIAEVR